MHPSSSSPAPPRWLHAWAVLTVVATLPLLFLGAEVTTKDAGMSDPVGYRHPWELLQLLADAIGLGLQIEYSHRLAGFTVGICAIVLAVGMAICDKRRGMRWLGLVALVLVCLQGMLGKYRVDLNALFGRNLALVHGAFAQVVIATLVSIAVVTSRGWINDVARRGAGQLGPRISEPAGLEDSPRGVGLARWSLLTTALIFGQLILGGVLRHQDFLLGSRLHLAGAFVVLGAVLWLIKLAHDSERRASLSRSIKVIAIMLGVQLLLGIEAWMGRAQLFYIPSARSPAFADWLRSAHYVIGTLIFATSVVIALKANRRVVAVENEAPACTLEGAL
jgi:cytochrome c oxidase assembly protein subunit 15